MGYEQGMDDLEEYRQGQGSCRIKSIQEEKMDIEKIIKELTTEEKASICSVHDF